MNLPNILVLAMAALLIGWLVPNKLRAGYILAASLLAIFWLQPASPIRNLDFWLSVSAICLTILVWAFTQTRSSIFQPSNIRPLSLIVIVILALASLRFIDPLCCLTASTPPPIISVIIFLAGFLLFLFIFQRVFSGMPSGVWVVSLLIILLFILLKTPALATNVSGNLRLLTGQDINLASSMDLTWLGFSYLAFRLLHTLRDYQTGKLNPSGLVEFASYALFFPTYTAGPIDRIQHFSGEMAIKQIGQQDQNLLVRFRNGPDLKNFFNGAKRIIFGIFKKFVLADSLALVSLSQFNAPQVNSTFWTWILLYAFSLRIYLDFSGYTDIAIGLGQFVGIKLPENFDHPYSKQNLTSFWNSWHITLSLWFRAYFFNPLTRALRANQKKLPVWGVILFGQLGTMLLIGLWHGVSWNFAIWGAWHGFGLFIHNRWADWTRTHPEFLPKSSTGLTLSRLLSWFFTFHYVTLGWVWFTLPQPALALRTFQQLFSFLPGI